MGKTILFACLLLTGCITAQERAAQLDLVEDQQCQSYGAKPGSDAYVACRTQVANQRSANRAAAINSGTVCQSYGTTTVCN
jgi:predicted ATPase